MYFQSIIAAFLLMFFHIFPWLYPAEQILKDPIPYPLNLYENSEILYSTYRNNPLIVPFITIVRKSESGVREVKNIRTGKYNDNNNQLNFFIFKTQLRLPLQKQTSYLKKIIRNIKNRYWRLIFLRKKLKYFTMKMLCTYSQLA